MGMDDRADFEVEDIDFEGEEELGLAELAGFRAEEHGECDCAAEKSGQTAIDQTTTSQAAIGEKREKEAGMLVMSGSGTIH